MTDPLKKRPEGELRVVEHAVKSLEATLIMLEVAQTPAHLMLDAIAHVYCRYLMAACPPSITNEEITVATNKTFADFLPYYLRVRTLAQTETKGSC